jgi:diketogulonate reductase-like aldo/keto reductase
MTTVPSLVLSNGHRIPALALGTWKSEPGEIGAAVTSALDLGYRHLDCAMAYKNEPVGFFSITWQFEIYQFRIDCVFQEIGAALATFVPHKIARQDIFITSKLWNTKVDTVLQWTQQNFVYL